MLTPRQKALLGEAKFKRTLAHVNNTEKRKRRIRKNAAKAFSGLAKFFHRTTNNVGRIASDLSNSQLAKNTKLNASYP